MSTSRLDVLGCPLDALTLPQAVARVAGWIATGGHHRGIAINSHKLATRHDPELSAELRDADLAIADGIGAILAARVHGHRLPGRVAGVDLMEALLARGDRDGWRVFLLGAKVDTLALAAQVLAKRHPGLRQVGRQDGFFDLERDGARIANAIRETAPDLLFVAMGSPRQERFLHRFGSLTEARFALGVGGGFDVLAGVTPRAPLLARRAGLEWAWRISREPRRWRRLLDPVRMWVRR